MTKSILSVCLGKDLELGSIKDLDEKVINYLPDLRGDFAKEATIRDLVTMGPGLMWDERYYSPFSIITKAYFYYNLSEAMLEIPIAENPGRF